MIVVLIVVVVVGSDEIVIVVVEVWFEEWRQFGRSEMIALIEGQCRLRRWVFELISFAHHVDNERAGFEITAVGLVVSLNNKQLLPGQFAASAVLHDLDLPIALIAQDGGQILAALGATTRIGSCARLELGRFRRFAEAGLIWKTVGDCFALLGSMSLLKGLFEV